MAPSANAVQRSRWTRFKGSVMIYSCLGLFLVAARVPGCKRKLEAILALSLLRN
jgi:hypothetical protein